MNIRCLFWNIRERYNADIINYLNYEASICDIIILAEAYDGVKINKQINNFELIQPYQSVGKEWIKIFVKQQISGLFTITNYTELYNNRIVAANIKVPNKKDFFLFGVHLHSKTNKDEKTQLLMNNLASDTIHNFIKNKHNRVIIAGDFNHNPYETFLNSKLTMNSLPNKMLVEKIRTRPVNYWQRTTFYNPMWNFLGDYDFIKQRFRHNGSYFYTNNNHSLLDDIHWNLLDQVIVSEPICDCIHPEQIEIINHFETNDVMKYHAHYDFYNDKGTFMNLLFSDHLPLKFNINTSNIN